MTIKPLKTIVNRMNHTVALAYKRRERRRRRGESQAVKKEQGHLERKKNRNVLTETMMKQGMKQAKNNIYIYILIVVHDAFSITWWVFTTLKSSKSTKQQERRRRRRRRKISKEI
jgi:hypothetical protein